MTDPPSVNPIADGRINAVLDRLHDQAARQVPGLLAHFALGTVRGLVGANKTEDFDTNCVRDKLIPIDRGQGWFVVIAGADYAVLRARSDEWIQLASELLEAGAIMEATG